MTVQSTPIPTDESWHALRGVNVGASESEALMGVGKYNTPFSLYHKKRGTLPQPELDDDRIFWGTHLEATIALGLAKRNNLRIHKSKVYLTNDDVPRAGATLDYEIETDTGLVPFEIKNVDTFIFMEEWDRRNGVIVPPVHIDIQVQHQIMVSGASHGFLGVLIGGNEAHLIKCPKHDGIQEALKKQIAAFWDQVDNDVEPSTTAGDLAAAQYAWLVPTRKEVLDLTKRKDLDDPACDQLEKYAMGAALAKQGESMKDEAKLALLAMAKNADKLLCSAGSFNSEQKAARTEIVPAQAETTKEVQARRNALAYPSKKTRAIVAAG